MGYLELKDHLPQSFEDFLKEQLINPAIKAI
jgi:hypothetical protein